MKKDKRIIHGLNSLIASLIFIVFLPLIPLFIELVSSSPNIKTLFLISAIYPISISVRTKNSAVFSLAIFLSIIFSWLYGSIDFIAEIELFKTAAYYNIFGFALFHFMERFYIHVVKGKNFFKF